MLIGVTGASGFLGRYIVNRLLESGHTCRCWARSQSDRGGFDPSAESRLQWIEGQLNDPGSTQTLVRGCDAVVHAALERRGAGFTSSAGDLVEFAEANILGSLRLMQSARKAGVERFVFISTCAVHDRILDDRKLDEAHPLWARSHYGAHKAAIEKFVHSFGLGDGWPICALRPTGIYGVARPAEQSRFFDVVRDVVAGRDVSSEAGGKEVHAADVARAVEILLNADKDRITGEAFNCYDRYIAHQEVAKLAKKIADSRSTITERNKGPKHQIDTSKIRALGMQFGGDALLEQTVRELVEAARSRR